MVKEVSPERQKEIQREKAQLRKEIENVDVMDIVAESESADLGERHYARQFKRVYNATRKGLVHLRKQRSLGVLTNEETYNKAIELLESFVN